MRKERRSYVKQYTGEVSRRKELLEKKAEAMGLKQYPHASSRVWIEKDLEPGILPSHFFVGDYLPGKEEPGFREYHVHFPVTNLQEFATNLGQWKPFTVRLRALRT